MKWDLNRIQKHIDDQIEESIHLDYKSAASLGKTDSKKKEISKDVSAMANSDGGVIIYGVSEFNDRKKSHLPEQLDPIVRSDFSKEWLEQVINSNINPKINDIHITPIPSLKEDEVIYVVSIPKGDTAHQANDKRYYKRYNFESVMMEDYEIKDIINRVKNPKISLEFEIHQNVDSDLIVYANNNSAVLANYVNCFIHLPHELIDGSCYNDDDDYDLISINGVEYATFETKNKTRDIIGYGKTGLMTNIPRYGSSYYDPILPTIRSKLRRFYIIDNFENIDTSLTIKWRTISDNSTNSGSICLSDIIINSKN